MKMLIPVLLQLISQYVAKKSASRFQYWVRRISRQKTLACVYASKHWRHSELDYIMQNVCVLHVEWLND